MPDKNIQSDNNDINDVREIKKNLNTKAETQVRKTEDASLQDDSYSFDEDNTDNEEFHDIDDVEDDASDLTDLFDRSDDLQ